jgi:hypothetical protein
MVKGGVTSCGSCINSVQLMQAVRAIEPASAAALAAMCEGGGALQISSIVESNVQAKVYEEFCGLSPTRIILNSRKVSSYCEGWAVSDFQKG